MPRPKKKPKRKKKKKQKRVYKKNGCTLTLCIDPKTGAAKIVRNGKCPRGYVKKINDAIRRGVILPREDED